MAFYINRRPPPEAGGTTNPLTLSAAITTSPTLSRQTGSIRTVTVTLVATLPRLVGWIRSVTVTLVPTLARRTNANRSASVGSSATVPRSTGAARSVTVTLAPTLSRSTSWARSVTVTLVPVLVRQTRKMVTTTALVLVATLGTIKVILVTLTATALTLVPTLSRRTSATRTPAVTLVPTIRRTVTHTFAAGVVLVTTANRLTARAFAAAVSLIATLTASKTGSTATPPRTWRTASVGLPDVTAVTPVAQPTRVRARSSATIAAGMTGKTRVLQRRFSRTQVCTLGYSNQTSPTDIPTLEASLGRKFHGLRQNRQLTDASAQNWQTAIDDYNAGRGPITYRSIQLNTGLYTDVTSGVWDATLTTWFNNLKAANLWQPGHAILTFMHEVALASNDFLGTSQNFIDAYRHIRLLGDSLGVSYQSVTGHYIGGPAKWAYTGWLRQFTNGSVDSPTAGKSYSDYDPDLGSSPAPTGTTYYDYVSVDPYNNLVSGSLKYGTNAATLLDGPRNAAITRGKEWMIGELGCQDGATSQNNTDKAAWLDSVRVYLNGLGSHGPGVCRHLLTTQETGSLYNWDSSAEALAAGQRLAASTYFS